MRGGESCTSCRWFHSSSCKICGQGGKSTLVAVGMRGWTVVLIGQSQISISRPEPARAIPPAFRPSLGYTPPNPSCFPQSPRQCPNLYFVNTSYIHTLLARQPCQTSVSGDFSSENPVRLSCTKPNRQLTMPSAGSLASLRMTHGPVIHPHI